MSVLKTEKLNFSEALQALEEGKCEGIVSEKDRNIVIRASDLTNGSTGKVLQCELPVSIILGKWSLVNPVTTPKAGEVWQSPDGRRLWVIKIRVDGQDHLRFVSPSGELVKMPSDIQHGKNGWSRVYSPDDTSGTRT